MPMIEGNYFTDLKRPGKLGVTKVLAEMSGPGLHDVADGERLLGPRFKVVDYEPGNGTRYEVQLTFIPSRPDSRFLMNIVSLRSSMPVNHKLYEHSLGYMREKMPNVLIGDCYALIPLVNDFIDECLA